ncbi:GNAT family N-acetyltransferase [Streptomyces sp. P01-B04]|uniref:GNAT family N-acetyltransferase n=1 Tax=Streptomyces poriferorum TaxID=2798799 RepID=UPI001C5E043A|nr:GNAT family N-acetyltransferase [Streptomyces poriferorum]MBW5249647.1 GNAT family N-acetyltransferase [Streptomyces poriferorum]MBW5259750.1 GNAT family N-acetyltransferase [Streptomyces poriferorum]
MLPTAPSLPPGYRSRPVNAHDIPAIHALVAACEREVHGRVQSDAGAIAADLSRPGLVPESDTVLVLDRAGSPAAWAWVDRRSEVDVHPGHRDRGLGAALLGWVESRARDTGSDGIVQTVPEADTAAVALLRSRGYRPLATAWQLEFPMPVEPAVPEPPTGVTVRPFRVGDGPAAHALVQDAFDEWQQRRQAYEEWAAHTIDRPAFAPTQSTLAFSGDQLVGAALALNVPGSGEGYVEQVAVRIDHRGRGLARLLLCHTFRAFHRASRSSCVLWTHSDTGALDLYLRVGMTVRQSSTVLRRDLHARSDRGHAR